MKYGTLIKTSMTYDKLRDIVGSHCGKSYIGGVIPLRDESGKEFSYILCYEGSYVGYLKEKKIFGKDYVFRFNWEKADWSR